MRTRPTKGRRSSVTVEAARAVPCDECGRRWLASARHARDIARGRRRSRCELCRRIDEIGEPDEEHFAYWTSFPPAELERLVDAMGALRSN